MSSGSLSAAFSSTADDGHHELALAVADVNAISIQDRKDQTLLGQSKIGWLKEMRMVLSRQTVETSISQIEKA